MARQSFRRQNHGNDEQRLDTCIGPHSTDVVLSDCGPDDGDAVRHELRSCRDAALMKAVSDDAAEQATFQVLTRALDKLLAPIRFLLEDPSVSEILINGTSDIFVERRGKLERADTRFASREDLESAARSIAQFSGKRLTPEEPSVEARLPDGSRVQMIQPPAARTGLCISIRRFLREHRSIRDLVTQGSLTEESLSLLQAAVGLQKNVIISGGTGTGKTTMLNALSEAFADHERVIVIEDTSELQIRKEHVVYLEVTKPDRFGRGGASIRELFRSSLRMRPDRIIVGECRGGEALDMIQAMTSGHSGSLSTVHANTPYDALHRLETLALMSDIDMPLRPLRSQIASAVDVVVQIARFKRTGRRRVIEISEIKGLNDDGQYVVESIYKLDGGGHSNSDGELRWTGAVPSFATEAFEELGTGLTELPSWMKPAATPHRPE
ncbi:CpaF family protein [Rhizobium bangladeshense]|nr:CpaF family protein [Rhizobium bangladeshense]MBX5213402.1 CpaF family protein [Rhizobium sp. NLR9a]MBX5225061.1 CpaF family protein [Rhizobium sp. NLR9b]MBX5237648.1 CpaF family protein [Rhizobium sp. NLR22b]MBX5243668.1 CpaF family protein [Rhizobium sp. NLR3b]MBX5251578.1 CpaF family protein [Rhizobium sp. NLR4b]MBX5255146.1 CpaF family protein [Rhizobium sp. NLR16b]MBX5261240.1 CpaF family protein [Rhizobium sp. NLR16a]MBX5274233.1 CpaF family protein [Rhizobium sp. NLR13a]MBX528033